MVSQLRTILISLILVAFSAVSMLQLQWAFSPNPITSAGHILERWDKAFVRHVHPVWLGENFPQARVSNVSQADQNNYFVWDQEVSGWSGLRVDYSAAPLDAIGQLDLALLNPENQLSNDIVCLADNKRCELRIVWGDAGKGRSGIEFVGVRTGPLEFLLIERSVLASIAPQLLSGLGD